jgi:hypothetical protein
LINWVRKAEGLLERGDVFQNKILAGFGSRGIGRSEALQLSPVNVRAVIKFPLDIA